jgi:hypothetical protein
MGSKQAHSTDCPQVPAALGSQRVQIFRALAVLDMCRLACASKFVGFDPEQLADALTVVQELMNGVAEAMESRKGRTAETAS